MSDPDWARLKPRVHIIALTPLVWIRHQRVIKRFILRRFGMASAKRESLADLWRLLRWSHAYHSNNLAPAREFITAHGRKLVNGKTFDEVMAAANGPT